MRTILVCLCIAAALGCGSASAPPKIHTPEALVATSGPATPQIPEGEDVLAEAREHNSDPFGSPPRTFRAGHVSPLTLDPSAIEHTAQGFRVRFPSGAPVVTPTVHQGLVIASGGFHSRELYAF